MGMMFVLAIEDTELAKEFLNSVQDNKIVGFRTQRDGKFGFRRAPVTFVYRTTPEGKCLEHAGATPRPTGQDTLRKMRQVQAALSPGKGKSRARLRPNLLEGHYGSR